MEIGVDTGGTFTDVICRRENNEDIVLKVPSTPDDPSISVFNGVQQLLLHHGLNSSDIERFVHGTTVATNAVLERQGAKTGLLATAGFADVLEIGRQMRTNIYELQLEPEAPVFLSPGARRAEVIERVSSSGEVLCQLDEESLRNGIKKLIDQKVESVAICFLFSFLNPVHELRAREFIQTLYPDLFISISSEVDPAFREYERTVATAFDAYTKPVLSEYLERLQLSLEQADIGATLQVMQSRGGISSARIATKKPVRLFLSGPAAGVMGGSHTGKSLGDKNLITVDIGGTSCDIALISEGRPLVRPEGKIDGYPVRTPMVDVNAIGSGGGSIAWIDDAGGLRVGPRSAGAEPGPACYGRGGKHATVTDASVVLGYLNPEYFAAGSVHLDPALAEQAIAETIAEPLSISIYEAALGIHRVVNAQMAEGMRLVSIKQGYDPREFSLIALGGAGPLHAIPLADELSVGKVIIPRHPGVLSAEGLLSAPTEHEVSCAFPHDLDMVEIQNLRQELKKLEDQCMSLMQEEGIDIADVRIMYSVDTCYVGQSHYLEIETGLGENCISELYNDFIEHHERVFGYSTKSPVRIVNLRTICRAEHSMSGSQVTETGSLDHSIKGKRPIMIDPDHDLEVTTFERSLLPAGSTIKGPAVVEQPDTTTIIHPNWSATVAKSGELVLQRSK